MTLNGLFDLKAYFKSRTLSGICNSACLIFEFVIRNRLFAIFTVNPDGYGAIVDQGNLHVGAKLPGSH